MTGIFLVSVALSPILLAITALRIKPIRALQRIAAKDDPKREAELDDLARRFSKRNNPHN